MFERCAHAYGAAPLRAHIDAIIRPLTLARTSELFARNLRFSLQLKSGMRGRRRRWRRIVVVIAAAAAAADIVDDESADLVRVRGFCVHNYIYKRTVCAPHLRRRRRVLIADADVRDYTGGC